ncbi:hypothetical protein [Gordonia paraffinivorans]|uniref:hypothetical protein n=1 Tax=Gordonia paraffinivorans TaxID=175628 RepID=UPI0012B76B25|nr:hypothetical protein [Gordonia paraffinivorans]
MSNFTKTDGARALGPVVMIEGEEALRLLKFAVKAGVAKHAYNGMRNHVLDVMFAAATEALAAMSESGHVDGQGPVDETDCDPTELIDANVAAEILGLSPRQVRRLGRTLGGKQLPNGCWTFHRGTVDDYVRERKRERSRSAPT